MPKPPIPSVVAMLLCDQVITEMGTNKKSLVGVFDNYFSLSFPVLLPRIAIYAKLADACGNYLFKLRVVKLKDEMVIAEVGIQAKIPDTTQYSELALNLQGFPIPEPGKYEFQLYAEDEYLHRITMNVELGQPPQPGGFPSWPPRK
jgi:hypothetical protein